MFTVTFDKQSSRKIFVAIGVCLLSLAGLGVANGSMSLYTVPLTEALGVERSVYAMYDTFAKVVGTLLSLGFAVIYKRVGAKGIALLAGLGYTVQYLCMAFATNVYVIWIGGIFGGMGYTFAGTLTIFAILPPWFPKTVGTISGIAASMSGLSSSVVIMLASSWISSFGYQQALIFEAIIIAAMSTVGVLLVKTCPDDPVAGKAALAQKTDIKNKVGGWQYFKRMLTNPATLLGMLIFFMIGALGQPFSSIVIPNADARGFAAGLGAAAYALHYAVIVPGKIGVGFLRDKIGLKFITPLLFIFEIASFLIAGFGPESWYMALGVIFGIGTVVNQIWPPYLLMDAFGKYYDAGMVGVCLALNQIGRAIGTPAIHIGYDMTGSYSGTLIVWAILFAIIWAISYVVLKLGKKYQAKRDAEIDDSESKNVDAAHV